MARHGGNTKRRNPRNGDRPRITDEGVIRAVNQYGRGRSPRRWHQAQRGTELVPPGETQDVLDSHARKLNRGLRS